MDKFEHLDNYKYIVAIAIADMANMQGEIIKEFGENECDMFASWVLIWLNDEHVALAKEHARYVIGEKIKELKGVENE